MNIKAVRLAGVSVGLWVVPTMVVAMEAPALPSSEDQNLKQAADLTEEDAPTTASANLTENEPLPPSDPVEQRVTEPLSSAVEANPVADSTNDIPSVQPEPFSPDSPPAESSAIAAVSASPSPNQVSTTATPANPPVEHSPALGMPAVKLYGEPDPIADLQPAFTDPLEQLSTEEWLDLISDPADVPHPTASLHGTDQQASGQRSPNPNNSDSSPPTVLDQTFSNQTFSDQTSDQTFSDQTSGQTFSDQTSPAQTAAPPLVSRSAADLTTLSSSAQQPSRTAVSRSMRQRLNQLERRDRLDQPFDQLTNQPGFATRLFASAGELDPPQPLTDQAQSKEFGQTRIAFASTPGQSVRTIDAPSWLTTSMAQVTSVSQLSDVQPTDWAYQALQSLVERYGVIEGYPDGLFRGERALTRYEFAAGVNAALDRLSQLVASSTETAVSKTDLETLQRLQDDFSRELISLRGRVDGLEARVGELEANQFSTTVVLNGQVTFGLADAWGGDPPGLGETNPVFAYLAQLQLSGSFSERDAFRIDFDSGNFEGGGFAEPQALNTQMALMGFQTDTNNTLELSGAEYRFAVGDRLVFTLKPVGFSLNSVLSPNSIYSSVSQGALSRFAAETPIFRIGSLDAGLGLDWLMTDRLRLQLAYGGRDASDPLQGLFQSDHRAFGVQLLARPFGAFTTGIAYVNAFAEDGFLDTFTGSNNADISGGFLEPAAIHAVSGTFQWQIIPSVIVGAWGGLTVSDSLSSDAVAVSSTYLFSLGFPDTFGREGDLLGIMVGQPLRLRYGLLIEREDEGSGLHYEIFYRIRVNDNISITPGVFVVTDPGHIPDNDTIIVGAIRTSFSF